MATTYLSPGVYIEEVDRGTKPIQGVPTSVTAFVGFTEKAEALQEDGYTTRSILSEAKLITNWGQYQTSFGGLVEDAYLPYAVRGFFDNGGTVCYVISVRTMGTPHPAQALVYAPDRRNPAKIGAPTLLIHAKRRTPDSTEIDGNQIKVEINLDQKGTSNPGPATEPREHKPGPGAPEKGTEPNSSTSTSPTGDGTTSGASSNPEAKPTESDPKSTSQPPPAKGGSDRGRWQSGGKGADPSDEPTITFSIYLGEGKKPVETQKVRLSDLPFWGNRPRESEADHQRFQYIKVWTLAKSGKIEERLPMLGTYSLDGAMAQLDVELLPEDAKAMLTSSSTNNKVDTIFKSHSQQLFEGNTTRRKGIGALDAVDNVNLICAPDLMMAHEKGWIDQEQLRGVQQAILDHCQRTHYRFAILDAPHNTRTAQEILDWRMNEAGYDSMHGAIYFPWLRVSDPVTGRSRLMPPSGYIAGIYARSDDERGVHKAPANEVVAGAIDVATNVTKGEQDLLNPNGINCIRKFPGRGVRVWGARTLSSDPSWRYINVRRLFNYVEESVELNTQWIVFEPNDEMLWAKVRRDISAFLRTVWLSGALFGASPEEAYYVKCDEETNLQELRDLGQMICEIGMAPVKPAEFVIFRFSQWVQSA